MSAMSRDCGRPLTADFFARDTRKVARDLIGAVIEVGSVAGRIVETEAYRGDPASHYVTRPRTGRIMGETHGHLYVYSIYGMHHCANVTTTPSALLTDIWVNPVVMGKMVV